jgi:glutaredoxin
MKKVLMFHFAGCPYCAAAERWISEVKNEHPELANLEIERIDEHRDPETADRYDYWFVPTFYVDGKKVHEGACTKKAVEQVLLSALA